MGSVVAVSRWKGHLQVMIRGWPRWYPVEHVRIEGAASQFLQGGTRSFPAVLPVRVSADHRVPTLPYGKEGLWQR